MEKRQPSPSKNVGSPSSEGNIPGESADDSSGSERADRSLATQQVQQMRQIFPGLPAPVTPIEESNTQQLAPVPIESVSPSMQPATQPSATAGSPLDSPRLRELLSAEPLFEIPYFYTDIILGHMASPTKRYSETASSSKSPSKGATFIAHSLLSPTKHSSWLSPPKDSTFKVPSSPPPTKRSISLSPSKSSTCVAPKPPSPTKSASLLSPPQLQNLSSPTKHFPAKRASSQSPMRGAGKSASGSPSPAKQPKLYHRGSDKLGSNMLQSLAKLFKCMEHIHFHPIHEFCTCRVITEGESCFHIPDSTKVTKTISEEDIEIRVDVRFYEIKNILVRVKEDAVSVEATRKTQGTSYEYHYIHQVFSLPSRLKNEKLCAAIKNRELIIKNCSHPEPSSKEEMITVGIGKQEKDPALPPSDKVTDVAVRQDGKKCCQPRPVEFTTSTSSNAFRLTLNVGLFDVKDITVNLIEDKIFIEAKREARDKYEFHYLDRVVPMPWGLQESSLSARIRNGELLVEGTVKPGVAEPRKIPWLSSREKPVFSKNFVHVPVVGHEGPCIPKLVGYTGTISDSQFIVKLNVPMFAKNDIQVYSAGKTILILAERSDSSPFEYHSVFKYCTLPIIVENFDIKSRIVDKHLVIEGSVKQK